MAYAAIDVARYIINYSNSKDYGVSNLKLQKLLYLAQAYFLIHPKKECKCFFDRIEAWDFGPVVPTVYREYKQYGSADIPSVSSYLVFDERDFSDIKWKEYSEDLLSEEDKELICQVVDLFSPYSASELVRMTHNQKPWIDAYVPNENNEITCESIREYFVE